MLIVDQSKVRLKLNLATAKELLTSLGFVINLNKSVIVPTQEMQFLGFSLDSQTMTIALPTSTGDVEMMFGEKDNNSCRAPPWIREHPCRLGVLPCERLQQ